MTTQFPRTTPKPLIRVAETGWSKARNRRGKGVRTCVAAVSDGSAPTVAQSDTEANIIRSTD
ncbi:hypothetical protein SAMN05216489_06957 [Streptomyces sp. 3213]|uniref:hypothetical protein n=1 Tax=Streptomyces sp. 3213.3 TaxID=1855348 RepID=UPI00089C545E|nr:hypothetical protein [Streptomyces sp. 3213.3]SEE52470.1 hypothetical protein SAMN05216489_06957 [Streptomyces sp. 3213] [Streptomyces sp. 3213.3]